MALRKYAISQKVTIADEQSAFKRCVNAFYMYNINLKGLNWVILLKVSRR